MQAKITEYVNTTQRTEEESFQETEIGLIPADWKVMRLGDYLALIRNGLTKRQNKDGIGVPVTRIETIAEDKIDPNKVGYVANISQEEIDKFRLKEGDILLSHINSEPQLGRSVVYTGYPPMLLHGMNLLLMRTWIDRLSPYFLNFLFAHYRQRGVFIGIASRAVGQSSINQGKMKSLKIPVPPLTEQKKIAKVLGTIQRAIEQQDKIIEAAKNLKKSLMQKLFSEGIGHTEFKETEIGEIPASWEAVRLGEILVEAYRYPTYYNIKYVREGVPEVRGELLLENGEIENDLSKFRFVSEDTAKNFPKVRLVEGDLVISVRGTMGKIGYVRKELEGAVITANLMKLSPNRKIINSHFLRWYLLSDSFKSTLNTLSPQTTIKTIQAPVLKSIPIPIPPLPEQHEIARILSTVDEKIEVEERRKATLNELFKTMLHKLMTGEIRLKDVEV